MSRHITSHSVVALALCATTALAACSSGSDSGMSPSTSGSVSIALTDAPFPFDSVARADLFVVRIDGRIADVDSVDADSGKILAQEVMAGAPDVVFFNATRSRVYVAIGDPGIIEVFGTMPLQRQETIATEIGAHTLSFDATRNIVCAFLPETHRAAVYRDSA